MRIKIDLRQARKTGPSPWRQFHNLLEVPGRGSSCTPPGPCAIKQDKHLHFGKPQTETLYRGKMFPTYSSRQDVMGAAV